MRRNLVLATMAAVLAAAGWFALHMSRSSAGTTRLAPAIPAGKATTATFPALDPVAPTEPVRTQVPRADPQAVPTAIPPPATEVPAATLLVSVLSKEDRSPLAHVRVHVHPTSDTASGYEYWQSTRGDMKHAPISDASGRLEISVAPNVKLSISASDESHRCAPVESEAEPLARGERREIVLEVSCANDGHYFGRLLDRETHQPVSGARIRSMRPAGWTQGSDGEGQNLAEVIREVRTDPAGRFEIWFAAWMDPYLRIDPDGYGPLVAPIRAGHERADVAEDVFASRAGSLHAFVRDASGKAIPGSSVRLKANGYALRTGQAEEQVDFTDSGYIAAPDERWSADVDAAGQCTIAGLPPRVDIDVEIRAGKTVLRRGADQVQLEPGQVLERSWTIGSGCRIEGLMVDQDRKPVAKHEVLLAKRDGPGDEYRRSYESNTSAARASTDDQGRFVLEDVAEGDWWLCPAPTNEYLPASSDAVAAKTQAIEVPAGGTLAVTLSVTRGLYLRGNVIDPDGKAVSAATISARQGDIWINSDPRSDKNGAFALGPLAPGTCTVWARSSEFATSEPLDAEPGQSGIVLRLRRGGEITGRVVDAAGQGVKATLHVQPEHRHASPMANGFQTGARDDGKFELRNLEPDRYSLAFTTADGRCATLPWIEVVADQESSGHIATLAPGAKLKVHYDGKEMFATYTILQDGGALTFPSLAVPGHAESHAVPAAHLTLEYHLGENGPTRTLSVETTAGETRDVVLKDD